MCWWMVIYIYLQIWHSCLLFNVYMIIYALIISTDTGFFDVTYIYIIWINVHDFAACFPYQPVTWKGQLVERGPYILFWHKSGQIVHFTRSILPYWLVVDLPLWQIWKSVGIVIPNTWKNKNDPNHQPAYIEIPCVSVKSIFSNGKATTFAGEIPTVSYLDNNWLITPQKWPYMWFPHMCLQSHHFIN